MNYHEGDLKMEKISMQNKFILHPQFKDRVSSLRNKVEFTSIIPSSLNVSTDTTQYQCSAKLSSIGPVKSELLNPKRGKDFLDKIRCMAYDESIDQFQALEGSGYVTCHSLVSVENEDYVSANCLSFAFYTRSKILLDQNSTIKGVDESYKMGFNNEDPIEASYKNDYYKERNVFILKNCPDDSLLLIDGPLISGVKTVFSIQLNDKLLERLVIPIFIVKNSTSNLVVDQTAELTGKYNSDLHWANTLLKEGERTNFFVYTDDNNEKISKVFCYIKPFENQSPQRIELHEDTYDKYTDLIPLVMDLIYYFYLDQGPGMNVQVRPIVIAEMYARETKKMFNIKKIMRESNIQATMNQTREMTL